MLKNLLQSTAYGTRVLQLALLLALLAGGNALAQAERPKRSDFEQILFPIDMEDRPGAFGSLWRTDVSVWNDNEHSVHAFSVVLSYTGTLCVTPPYDCSYAPLPAKSGVVRAGSLGRATSRFVYVQKPFADKVHFSLRVRDLSRQAETWGAEVPVVREREAKSAPVHLLNIPLDERYRQTLRIYEFDALQNTEVMLRIFPGLPRNDAAASIPLVERRLTVGRYFDPFFGFEDFPMGPSYLELGSFRREFVELAGHDQIRIEIQPITPGMRFWAFVSITNNETHHVTTITPQ